MDSQSPVAFNGDSPLHVAVRQGQIEDVRNILVRQQLDVNILNSKHETPLHLARSKSASAIVQLLIAFGANPYIRDSNNATAYSCSYGIATLMNSLLFRHGLWINSPTQTNGDTPLHTAVRLGIVDDVQRMIEEQVVDINDVNASHETPLHLACALGHKHIVHILISNGADMYIRDCYNNASIHRAMSHGHVDILDCLITDFACDQKIKGYQGRTLLHFACGIGNANLVNTLIQKHGFSPMATDAVNQTPLHIAASHGQKEVVCLLITKYNSLVDCRSNSKFSPLHLASYGGHVSVVKTLVLEYKADVNALDEDGDTPFPKAAMEGNLDLVEMMITDFNFDPLSAAHTGNTPLHMACWGDHEELARLLITKYNCPVNVKNKTNETPLHKACSSGHLGVVKMLISEFKADMDAREYQNNTPLHKAALSGQTDVVQMLITKFNCSPQVKGYDGRSLLHEACRSGSIKLIEMLITDFNLDPLSVDDSGNTPLHMSCWCGHEELARLLITKFNCPVDVKDKTNETPLHYACSSGHLIVIQMLICEFKADTSLRNLDNDTTVSKAAKGGHAETVQTLITDLGYSPKVKGYDGRSLLHEACRSGSIKLTEMLITDFNLDPLSVDDSGNTPLHMSCWCGHEELARLLITKYNCPVDVKNKNKWIPLHMACSFGHLGVSKILLSNYSNDRLSADCNILDKYDNTPLDLVIKNGDTKAVHILSTEYGCIPHIKGAESKPLLHQLCAGGFAKMLQELISNFNHDPASVDEHGNTLLHTAAQHGNYKIVEFLIANHCNHCPIDCRNSRGQTALHCACIGGHTGVAKVLIANKADITVRDEDGDTPLKKAFLMNNVVTLFEVFNSNLHKIDSKLLLQVCKHGAVDMVDVLLSVFNLDPSFALDSQGNKVLHIATIHGHKEIIALLINKYKCPVDSRNFSGNTPLHLACWLSHQELTRLLITIYNSPVDVKNKDDKTPLHLACFHGHFGISKILLSEYMQQSDKRFSTDCNTLDKDNNTPLDLVIKNGDTKAVHILSTEYGCKPHIKGAESKPLLHQLCAGGFVKMLQELTSNFSHDPASVDEDGNTLLHTAAQHGQYKIVEFLIANHCNHCPIDCRNSRGQTALHCACIGGHTRVAKLLAANKADITVRDEDGHTALKKAFLTNNVVTLFNMFNSTLYKIDSKLLRRVCERGSIDLVDILLSDFNLDPSSILDSQGNKVLHIATTHDHKEIITLLINKYKCPVDSRNFSGQTPLHLLCAQTPTDNVDALIKLFINEFKADMTSKDINGDQPIHTAAQAGFTGIVINLVLDCRCSPKSRGFKERTLLHHALAMGHTSTAKALIDVFHLSLHSIDDDGNTPLHLSSLSGQSKSVRILLYDYHAPVFVRNKAGKTALDLAKDNSTKKVIREYVRSKHKSIQQEYEELRTKSLQKYSDQQIITRVFVLGNPGSGKSTLVESLKRKGIISSFFLVPEADVPLHTAGIVPSIHQSKEAGRLLYYDFAGDVEYYSSHAAILEMVSHSTVGTNVYLIVANLTKDCMALCNEIGYWLSFISYHGKILDSQCELKVIVVLSHSDCLSEADSTRKLESIRQYLHTNINQSDEQIINIVDIISSNCRYPRSSKIIESTLQQICKDTPPCSLSFETTLLHGMLEKDFGDVVACNFQDLLSNIKDTGIYLPTSADALYPIVKELHDIGVLMMIGRSKDQLENHLLLLKPSTLTNEVHQKLFSDSAMQKIHSSLRPNYANMGILPESYLANILPEHITKECLVQLQYCQEFSHAEVGPVTPNSTAGNNLLYFPALCKLNSEQCNWPSDPKLTFSIGWYTKCTGKFDYFPARFLHVLLLRLAFAFALPIADCNISESNEVSAHNRRCTMWKNGIRWLMEEGVECIFEIVNDNKGIVVITKSKDHSEKSATILSKILYKTMQAKAKFCDTVSLHHFLLNSGDISSFMCEDNLFEISEVERVIREGKESVVSVNGRTLLDSSHLFILKKLTYWGMLY